MRHLTRIAILAGAVALAFAHGYARADVDLPMVCTDPAAAGKSVSASCGGTEQVGQVYKTPGDTDLVRIRPGSTTADWTDAKYLWAAWKDVSPGDYVDRCTSDVPQGSLVTAANCLTWAMKPKAGPNAPIFTVSPTSGTAPLAVTITWNVDQGSQCQAGGGWSGAKAQAGTQSLTLTGNAALTLMCSRPTGPSAPGSALLTWTAPTQNTDGTAYSDPAGFQLYTGTSDPPQVKQQRITAPGSGTRTIANQPPNTVQYFGISAINAAGNESAMCCSPALFKWIPNTPTAQAWTGSQSVSVTVPVNVKPKAPILSVQ